eukprot:1842608-Amphidinium_carterae.1
MAKSAVCHSFEVHGASLMKAVSACFAIHRDCCAGAFLLPLKRQTCLGVTSPNKCAVVEFVMRRRTVPKTLRKCCASAAPSCIGRWQDSKNPTNQCATEHAYGACSPNSNLDGGHPEDGTELFRPQVLKICEDVFRKRMLVMNL